jgi:hypothetical protein
MGHNIALAGMGTMFILKAEARGQSVGALVGGLAGTALGLRIARNMTEADAVGAGFGSDLGALIGLGVSEVVRGDGGCSGVGSCKQTRAEVAAILASGLIGYPLGVLYPRNARYHVTAGDINTLWSGAVVGVLTGAAILPESPRKRAAAAALTGGGLLGVIVADRFLVQRADHGRTEATQLLFGTGAGGLMGAGIVALFTRAENNPQPVFIGAAAGSLVGMIATERYLDPAPDAGRRGPRLSFNPSGIFSIAARAPGNHSLINVRF